MFSFSFSFCSRAHTEREEPQELEEVDELSYHDINQLQEHGINASDITKLCEGK